MVCVCVCNVQTAPSHQVARLREKTLRKELNMLRRQLKAEYKAKNPPSLGEAPPLTAR